MIPRMRFFLLAVVVFTCFASIGCATRTETFDVTVRNESAGPVTIWLTKTGGPEEEGWRSPESIAINFVVEDEKLGGVIVPPRNTATTGKTKGKFDRDSYAVLRVYRGEMKMSEMLANGKDSPNRADLILQPGQTRVGVTDKAGKMTIYPLDSSASAGAHRPKQ
jgi:hypothetical protein